MIQTHLVSTLTPSDEAPTRSKRQIKPSSYAASIRSFKEQQDKNARKSRTSYPLSEETNHEPFPALQTLSDTLKCRLPRGRKLNLSIIICKKSHKKIAKKKITGPRKETTKEPQPITVEAKDSPFGGADLLEKFLMAAQELNKMEQSSHGKQGQQNLSMSQGSQIQLQKKEGRMRGQKNEFQKVNRFYQKERILSQKLQNLLTDMVYL